MRARHLFLFTKTRFRFGENATVLDSGEMVFRWTSSSAGGF